MYVWEEGGGWGGGAVTASHSVSQDGKNVWRRSPAAYVHVAGPASVSVIQSGRYFICPETRHRYACCMLCSISDRPPAGLTENTVLAAPPPVCTERDLSSSGRSIGQEMKPHLEALALQLGYHR